MKHVLILAVVILTIFSCSKPDPREPFLGKWKVVETSLNDEIKPRCYIEARENNEMRWNITRGRGTKNAHVLRVDYTDANKAKSTRTGIPILLHSQAELILKNDTLYGKYSDHSLFGSYSGATFVMVRP